jgi:hypothetical protein
MGDDMLFGTGKTKRLLPIQCSKAQGIFAKTYEG